MPAWRSDLDEWFCTHHGIAGRNELLALGLNRRTISRMAGDGRLVEELPGVYRSAQWPASDLSAMRAVCARNQAALIGYTTAGRLWGLRRLPPDRLLHVIVPHGSPHELGPGFIVHRCRRIDDVDRVERPDGIRLTSPPRTICDSADMLGFSATRSVVEQLIHERMCTLGTIVDTHLRLRHPHRPGSRTMARVLADRPAWRAALQSNLELIVLEECERQRLPTAVPQCPVVLPDGRTIHLDLGWPEWRVGLEVDHPAWHAGAEESRRDRRRDRKAAVVGWAVVRVTTLDTDGVGLSDAVADVAMLIRQRRDAARPAPLGRL